MDWAVLSSDVFIAVAVAALVAAPFVGVCGGWRALRAPAIGAIALVLLGSLVLLAASWRGIPGGIRAAFFGHAALIVSAAALAEIGRVARVLFRDPLAAAMAGLVAGVVLVVGIFALAPLTENASPSLSAALLFANPLVAVTSAAGIDLLHLDTFYRTSPLAHRGVAVPAWTTACVVYAVVGLAAFGASRIRPWSPRT